MKKIVTITLLLFLAVNMYAQKGKKEVIYLKNGSVLKGRLAQLDDDKVVLNSGKNLFVLKSSEIDTTTRSRYFAPMELKNEPYFLRTSVGVLAGSSNNYKSAPFTFDITYNQNIFKNYYVGVGIGADILEQSYMPAFLNFEYHFRQTSFTPFVGLKAGYLIPVEEHISTQVYYDISPWSSYIPNYSNNQLDSKGGILINPALGFVSRFNQSFGLSLSFGYRFYQLNFKGDKEYELHQDANRLSISLGIIFN